MSLQLFPRWETGIDVGLANAVKELFKKRKTKAEYFVWCNDVAL